MASSKKDDLANLSETIDKLTPSINKLVEALAGAHAKEGAFERSIQDLNRTMADFVTKTSQAQGTAKGFESSLIAKEKASREYNITLKNAITLQASINEKTANGAEVSDKLRSALDKQVEKLKVYQKLQQAEKKAQEDIAKALKNETESLNRNDSPRKNYAKNMKDAVDLQKGINEQLAKGLPISEKTRQALEEKIATIKELIAQLEAEEQAQEDVNKKALEGVKALEKNVNMANTWVSNTLKVVSVLGFESASLTAIRDKTLKYNQSLFELSRSQQMYGKSLKDIGATFDYVSKNTTMSRQQFIELSSTMNRMYVGMTPNIEAIGKMSARLKEAYGPDVQKQMEGFNSLMQIQNDFPAMYDAIEEAKARAAEGDKDGLELLKQTIILEGKARGYSNEAIEKQLQYLTETTDEQKNAMEANEAHNKVLQKNSDLYVGMGESVKGAFAGLANIFSGILGFLGTMPGLVMAGVIGWKLLGTVIKSALGKKILDSFFRKTKELKEAADIKAGAKIGTAASGVANASKWRNLLKFVPTAKGKAVVAASGVLLSGLSTGLSKMGTFIKEGLIKASENLPKMGAFIREGLSKIKSGGIGTFFKEGLSKIKSSGIGTFFGEGLSKIKSSGIGTFFKEGLSKIGIGGGATVAEKVATSGLPKTGIGTVAKWGAKKIPLLGALIDAGFSAFDEYGESTKKGESKKTAKKRAAVVGASTGLGSGLGVWGGAAAGAAIGSAVPIIGTVVGGIVGGIIGSIAGGYGGKKAGQAISGATIKGEAEKKNTTDISKNAKEITKEAKTAAPLEKAKAEDMEKQKKTTMEIIRELDKQNKNVVAIVQKNEQITKAMSDQLNLLKSMGLLTADKLASSFDIMMSSAKASQAETERAINKVGTSLIDLRKNLNLTEEEAAKFKQAQDSIASEDYDKGIQELSKAYADLKRKKTEALKDLEIKNPKITLDNKPINELTEAEKEAKKQADLLKVQIANIDRQMGMSTQNANNYYSSLQKGGQAIQMAYSEGIKYADEMSDAAERRISTERKLQETAMLGMAPSIEMMQQQIDQQKQLATDYAKARDLGREKALSELGIQGARGNALIEELRMAKSKNDLEAIAVKYKMEEGDAMSKLKPMYIEEQNAATKIAEANQKILDLTKQVREGYLSAIQEMSIGNTEYTKIIGTQEMGVTQLMTTVNKASKEMNRLNTLTLGGITSDKTTGIEPIAQMAVGPVGPQLQVSPQASKNMNRIYEWEESSREIKNMSQGNSTGKNYNAGEALANSAYLTPIQDGKPHSFKSIPATLENTLMDASKLTAGEKKRGESVPTQVNLGANIINNAKLGTGEYDIKAMTVANAVIQNLQGVASGALGASKTVEKAGAAQNKPSTFAYNLWANSPNTSALAQSSVAAEAPLTKAVEKIAKTVPVMVQAAEKMNQAATKINTDNSDKKSNRKLEGKDENFAERQRALERQKVTRTRDLETTIRRNAAAARAVERQEKKAKEREEREEKVKAAKKAEKKDNTKEIKHHVPVSKKESTAKRDTFSKSGVPKSNYLEYIGPESAFPKRGVSKANYLEGRNAKAVTTATGLYDAKEMQASKDALVQQEKNEEILKGYREYANLRDAPKIQTEAMKQDEAIKKGISVANRLNDHFASSGNKEKVNITVTVKQDGQLACTLQRAAALVSELAPAGSTRHQN